MNAVSGEAALLLVYRVTSSTYYVGK